MKVTCFIVMDWAARAERVERVKHAELKEYK